MKEVSLGVGVMGEVGMKRVLVWNGGGGRKGEFEMGEVMIISEEMNVLGEDGVGGKNME